MRIGQRGQVRSQKPGKWRAAVHARQAVVAVQEAKRRGKGCSEGLRAAQKGTVSSGGLLCLGKRRKLPIIGYPTLTRRPRTLDRGCYFCFFLLPVPFLT